MNNKTKINKTNRQNNWYILSNLFTLLLELDTADQSFHMSLIHWQFRFSRSTPYQSVWMDWRQQLYSSFNPISSRSYYALLLPCPHVSKCFFSVMSCSSWVDSWLCNIFCFDNRTHSTWFLQAMYGQPECVYYLWVYFSDLIC